jgi:large subunit ribosomal protein L11
MVKKIKALIKLDLPAGKATPAPPVGPALGQHGINIGSFCTEYNKKTSDKEGLIIPVKITIYDDRSYTFILKSPPAAKLLLKYANIKKGSAQPNKEFKGEISINYLKDIARIKLNDLNTKNLEKALLIIKGTANNMGIRIKE